MVYQITKIEKKSFQKHFKSWKFGWGNDEDDDQVNYWETEHESSHCFSRN